MLKGLKENSISPCLLTKRERERERERDPFGLRRGAAWNTPRGQKHYLYLFLTPLAIWEEEEEEKEEEEDAANSGPTSSSCDAVIRKKICSQDVPKRPLSTY